MRRPLVAVTGVGVAAPSGAGVDAFWEGLVSGEAASVEASHLRPGATGKVGVIPGASMAEIESVGRSTELAVGAVVESFDQARTDAADAAVVVGTTDTGGRAFEDAYRRFRASDGADAGAGGTVNLALGSRVAAALMPAPSRSITLGNASASSAMALGVARDLIHTGEYQIAVAAAGDGLCPSSYAGLGSLRVLTTRGCRSYNRDRSGIHASEAGASLVIESLDHARRRGAPVSAIVSGFGSSNATDNLVRLGATTIASAVRAALDDAEVGLDDIDLIKAHGTGTPQGDEEEIAALRAVFGDRLRRIAIVSWKPTLGHCQGAAGAVEAVGVIEVLRRQMVAPVTGITDLDPSFADLDLVTEARPMRVDNVLALSCGFGGTAAAIVLRRGDDVPLRAEAS